MQSKFTSHSPEETQSLGRTWGEKAIDGMVIGFSGDLGVGKTQLIKGFAEGLGYRGKVQSPTFALINEYHGGRLPIYHLDLYRLETRQEIIRAGLEEFVTSPDGVAVIEWIERWTEGDSQWFAHGLKRGRLVSIKQISDTEREIFYEDFGA